ncbi:MAG: hypothetical protein ACR2JW_05465 [Thermomicrobiales bacterium]
MKLTEDAPAFPFGGEARAFVSFRFWQYMKQYQPQALTDSVDAVMRAVLPNHLHASSENAGARDPVDTYETVVEASTLTEETKDVGEETEHAFTLLLEHLQQLLRAYQVTAKHHVPILTRHRLQPAVLLATRDAMANTWSDSMSIYITSLFTGEPIAEPPLDSIEMDRLAATLQQFIRRNPVVIVNERMVMARYALNKTGDYAGAVIHAHIAVEVLMDSVLTFALFEEQMKAEDAAVIFSEAAQKRVRTHYGKRLGGDWNPNTSKAIMQWAKVLAPMRNRIVHMGYLPSYEEAHDAIDVVPTIADFVLDRIVQKRVRYPYLALIFLGRSGLEERKAWTRRIIDLSATLDIPEWLKAYNRWRGEVETLAATPKHGSK